MNIVKFLRAAFFRTPLLAASGSISHESEVLNREKLEAKILNFFKKNFIKQKRKERVS